MRGCGKLDVPYPRESGCPLTPANRSHPTLVDAIEQAMTLPDHHDWITHAAASVVLGGNELWRAMCSVWVDRCLDQAAVGELTDAIEDGLGR